MGVSLSPKETESKAPSTEVQTFRVVLVEDDNDARLTMEELRELDGHEITAAVDGYDGLEKIRSVQPDFALIDLSMPGISGHEVASRLQSESPELLSKTQLIALTGHGQPQDIQRTQDAGFAAHMVKPVDVSSLGELMTKLAKRD